MGRPTIATTCARRTQASLNRDQVDSRAIYFLDAGVWNRNATDFALVSNKDILLCSWRNAVEPTQTVRRVVRATQVDRDADGNLDNDGAITLKDQPNRYSAGIQHILGRSDRGVVTKAARAFVPLTAPDETILILPDLHLHLMKLSPMDNFTFQGADGKTYSLEDELADLLDRAEAANAEIVQVGDCFEMWEAQAYLIGHHSMISMTREQYGGHFPRKWDAWEKMWRERKIVPRRDYNGDHGKWPDRDLSISDVSQRGIEFEDSDAIKGAIMTKYPRLFQGSRYGPGMRFKWIHGNHDNMLANRFYGTYYSIRASKSIPPQVHQPGGLGRIWSEHGHYYDEYNRNDLFDRPKKGYDYTRANTFGGRVGVVPVPSERSSLTMQNIKDAASGDAYDMRVPHTRRTAEIISQNPDVRLVVMGHKHDSMLFEYMNFIACESAEVLERIQGPERERERRIGNRI